jgi:oligosaccharide amylase
MESFKQPILPGGITGNSRMLATIRANGELHRLFWPNIDWGQHMGILMAGVQEIPGCTCWLGDHTWQQRQYYIQDTNSLVTESTRQESGITVLQTDLILADRDVLLRTFNIKNLYNHPRKFRLVIYCSFEINESEIQDCMYVDHKTGFMVQFRRGIYLGLAAAELYPSGFHCGRRNAPSDPFDAASRGEFWGGPENIKNSAGAMAWDIGSIDGGSSAKIDIHLAAAGDARTLSTMLSNTTEADTCSLIEDSSRYWSGWLSGSLAADPEMQHFTLFNRSLLAVKLMSDNENGSSVAAPEFDSHYLASGGYGYCWPRDGMFAALALDEAGLHHEAAQFYRFASRVQNPDGSWQQRYFINGGWAPTWGSQIDQTGAVLWGYRHHYLLTGDKSFLDDIWPSALAGAKYLASNILSDNSLPLPGMDLWEDEFSQNTYAAAAVWGGLTGASDLARFKNEIALAKDWENVSRSIKKGIADYQWSPEQGTFTRAINRRVCLEEYHYAREQGLQTRELQLPGNPITCFMVPRDGRIDSALLGLCFPFGVFSAGDPLMSATAASIRNRLGNLQVGGIHRYENDSYAGGNPWVLCTLWLSIYLSLKGEKVEAEELIRWAEHNSSATGLLPEQVHKTSGGPAWVLPLNWSHAMYVLACLAARDKLKCNTFSTAGDVTSGD